MKTYIALLRGINVGGNNKVPMSELKDLFLKIGFTDVRTYINSGNVICTGSQDLVERVESEFEKKFGFYIRFLFLTQREFQSIHDVIPADWVNDSVYKTDVWFLWEQHSEQELLETLNPREKIDHLIIEKNFVIWHVLKKNFGKSHMNKVIGSELYKNLTVRNVNTVRKLMSFLLD